MTLFSIGWATRQWRGNADMTELDAAPLMGLNGGRALNRATTALSLALVITGLAIVIGDTHHHDRPVIAVVLAALVLSWSVWLAVIMFNKPRFLVPPVGRADRGLLSLWWEDRRAERKRAKELRW